MCSRLSTEGSLKSQVIARGGWGPDREGLMGARRAVAASLRGQLERVIWRVLEHLESTE